MSRLTRADSDRDDWENRFLLPTTPEMIRLTEINPGQESKPSYELADGYIYTNVDELVVQYVYPQKNPQRFDVMLATAIATYLASLLALPIMNNVEIQGKYEQMAEVRIREASHIDFMQNDPDRGDYESWVVNG